MRVLSNRFDVMSFISASYDPKCVPPRIRPIAATHWCASLMLALSAHVCPLSAQGTTTLSLPNPRTARELGAGLVGSLGGIIVGGQAGRLLGDAVRGGPYRPVHDVEFGDPYANVGMLVGQVTGSAVAVYYAGRMGNVQDSFGQTLLGAAAGELAGAAVYFVTRDYEGFSVPAAAVLVVAAPIGAVIAFNRSRRAEAQSGASAGPRHGQYRVFTLRFAF